METTDELRRKNLVKVDGKIYKVFSLDSCFVGLSEVGKDELLFDVDVSKVELILLTDDILLNWLMFEHSGVGYNKKSFNIWFSSYLGCYVLRFCFIGSDIEEQVQIIHTNHLQNLYQSLTGTELKLKL